MTMREIEGIITHRHSVPLVYEQTAPVVELEAPSWAFYSVGATHADTGTGDMPRSVSEDDR